jgi:hypothetical protein
LCLFTIETVVTFYRHKFLKKLGITQVVEKQGNFTDIISISDVLIIYWSVRGGK